MGLEEDFREALRVAGETEPAVARFMRGEPMDDVAPIGIDEFVSALLSLVDTLSQTVLILAAEVDLLKAAQDDASR
jgi:hypothetical protein